MSLIALVLLSVIAGLGCQSLPEEEFFKLLAQAPRNYQVTLPKEGWKSLEMEGADIAMESASGGAAFAIFIPSRMKKADSGEIPLGVLRTELLLEIKGKKIISSEYLTLAGQQAIRTLLEGKVEGEKVKIEAYTLTKGDLVYDIVYWARPEEFEIYHKDFQQMMESFRFVEQTPASQ
ncbi:MAG TPA: hypothetical protein ACFYD3_08010 [Candidatus Hypogeohydataceae bacterium YC41]